MPIIHFAFGSHFRNGEEMMQADSFLEKILLPKTLMAFDCPEFIPILNSPNAKFALPSSVYVTQDGGVSFNEWIDSPPVSLLPNDVPMISFVDIPYTKLSKWSPSNHYGRLGIAFSNDFKRRANVRNVSYYKYPNLSKDPLVIKLNKSINENDELTKNKLWNELLYYRKPSKLWEEINTLFSTLKLSGNSGGVNIETITYSRYDIDYDFEIEKEARIVTTSENRIINFKESEILSIIVPNEKIKNYLSHQLEKNWEHLPTFLLYPSLA